MPKLAILGFPGWGHVNPTLPVARELVRRGVDVIFFAPTDFVASIKETGARFIAYESILVAAIIQALTEGPQSWVLKRPLIFAREAAHVLPQIMPVLRSEAPDALAYDFGCFCGAMVAELLGLPGTVFYPTYAPNEHWALPKLLPPVDPQHPAMAQFHEQVRDIAASLGTRTYTVEDIGRAQELNIVFMPRAFQVQGDTFDGRYEFVGPSIAARPGDGTYRHPADDPRPLLFVSLGTAFNDWPEFYRICIKAFGGKPWRVLMVIGQKVDLASLGNLPPNIAVDRYVPQLEVLQHARVFVTHGGMNSTQEALWYGVPLVVVPQMYEQAVTARRVAALGLGKAFLERAQVTPEALLASVEELSSDPVCKANIESMKVHVRGAGGYQRAANLLVKSLERAKPVKHDS